MIDEIQLTNFKCFSSAKTALGKINVFAGANGTGKSSVIQALLLLIQSSKAYYIARDSFQLNGEFIELGAGKDVLYKKSNEDYFTITVIDNTGSKSFTVSVSASEIEYTLPIKSSPSVYDASFLRKKFSYLSADRLGPQKAYPVNMDDLLSNEIGRRGEYAPLLYNRNRLTEIKNPLLLLENSEKKQFNDCESQFGLWMSKLFPGFQARTAGIDKVDSVILGLNLQDQIGEPEFFRPGNVGFGVSVVFPIILAGLLADSDTTLIIENPEAHLHPTAQSLLGEFLVRVAACGCQIFIETHSDHLVNGMRVAFKNKLISKEDIRFFAFSKTTQYGSHKIETVALNDAGDFVGRPEYFFDQADRDISLIYGIE